MMRYLAALLLLLWFLVPSVAQAQTATATASPTATPTPGTTNIVNRQGTLWQPVAVGTATPVTVMPGASRCSWAWNWTDAGDLMCAPIRWGAAAADFTPSSTQGFRFTAAKTPWTNNSLLGDASIGWQCVSTSGTVNVYTYEDLFCFNKKVGSP